MWSTRQVADLSGVTVRAIRHWHSVGLLPEPERTANGYKQYLPQHLVRALRIARLSNLGFSLDRIRTVLDSESAAQPSLRSLKVEIGHRIAELEKLQSEIDQLIQQKVAPDLSPLAYAMVSALGDDPASKNLGILFAHLLSPDDVEDIIDMLAHAPQELQDINVELLHLPDNADKVHIENLAFRTINIIKAFLTDAHPSYSTIGADIDDAHGINSLKLLIDEGLNLPQRTVLALVIEQLTSA